ncbi:hypothetical protein [Oceanobacillus profundus]|nr:hypothetical protein [Oceanobacillus profundus]
MERTRSNDVFIEGFIQESMLFLIAINCHHKNDLKLFFGVGL